MTKLESLKKNSHFQRVLRNRVIKSKKEIENDTNIIIETSFAKISAEVKEIKDE